MLTKMGKNGEFTVKHFQRSSWMIDQIVADELLYNSFTGNSDPPSVNPNFS